MLGLPVACFVVAYGTFDRCAVVSVPQQGVPTHDSEGVALEKKKLKGVKKAWMAQKRKHDKWLAKQQS